MSPFQYPDAFLKARSAVQLAAIAGVLAAALAVVDYRTGYEISFSFFYLIPISIATWYGNRRLGFLFGLLCDALWLAMDLASGHAYSHPAIPFWNAAVRLGFFWTIAYLLSELRKRLDRERELARVDGLTGVLNARAFREGALALFALAARQGQALALGYVDLDNFKGVNDSQGHSAGDAILRAVAFQMSRSVRTTDLVGRLGGDEFAVLLPQTDRNGAENLFAKLRESLQNQARAHGWPIGFSMGVAVFRQAPASADEALHLADSIMYRVKQAGKNAVLFGEA